MQEGEDEGKPYWLVFDEKNQKMRLGPTSIPLRVIWTTKCVLVQKIIYL